MNARRMMRWAFIVNEGVEWEQDVPCLAGGR
jgi:hypothetical protein